MRGNKVINTIIIQSYMLIIRLPVTPAIDRGGEGESPRLDKQITVFALGQGAGRWPPECRNPGKYQPTERKKVEDFPQPGKILEYLAGPVGCPDWIGGGWC